MILIACIGIDSFAEERLVRVAGDPYPPWTEGEAGSQAIGGIAVEIAEELFRRLEMDIRVIVYPFKRGLERIEHGEEDVILMLSKTKERENNILFTSPIRHSKWVFYYLKGKTFRWSKWEDLQTYRIGLVTGNNVGKDFPTAAEKYHFNIEKVKADIFNADKLLLGRVDIVLADLEVMQRIINRTLNFKESLNGMKRPFC